MPSKPDAASSAMAPPAKRGKREERKAHNRQAILEAARQVFSELGYGATSVRDIIRQTGLASGTFYNYFKSKEEVFEALMDDNALTVRPRLSEVRSQARSFEEFVHGMFYAFFDFCRNDRSGYALMRRNAGHLRFRVDTAEVVAGFEELQADLERAIAQGLVDPVDADYLSAAIIGVAFEIGDRLVLRETVDVDEATNFATALFMGGVKALPSKR